jgi:hypothetical protein
MGELQKSRGTVFLGHFGQGIFIDLETRTKSKNKFCA